MSGATLDPIPAPLDTAVRLVTPERITFRYPLAGPFSRACAYLIDLAVIGMLLVLGLVVALAVALGTSASLGLWFLIAFVVQQSYGAGCEAVFNGRTAGKWALGLRVVATAGVPITGGQALLRNLLWAFDGIYPFAFLPALACMMLTSRSQRLGDLAAGTMVIVERGSGGGLRVVRLRDRESDAALAVLPAAVPGGSELSRALADYAGRRGRFSAERREEIAAPLAGPLRRKYGLPPATSGDAILCALYRRHFLGD